MSASKEEIIKRLEKERQTTPKSEDCVGIKQKSRNWVIVMIIITMITFIPLLIFSLRSTSAIVDIRIDIKDMSFIPDQPILIANQGGTTKIYANATNATFTPMMIDVLYLYPEMDQFFSTELALQQFPNRIIDDTLNESFETIFRGQISDYGLGGVYRIINDTDTHIQIRLSADYKIFVKLEVVISFDSIPTNFVIAFIYSVGHDETDFLGKPLGQTSHAVKNSYTWSLNITGVYYDYSHNSAFFGTYDDIYDIEPYPFILNATQTTVFDWNNFVGVK